MSVTIPISVGELVDKYSILQIKRSRVVGSDKLQDVDNEISLLSSHVGLFIVIDAIDVLYEDLVGINCQLWDVYDELRTLEKEKRFGERFIELSRTAYHLNDERYSIKNKINRLTNSDVQEVKQYIEYR